MSYFIFGAVKYKTDPSAEVVSDLFVNKASESNIWLLQKTDQPKVVQEMLREQVVDYEDKLGFTILESEACDTSDSIVSPASYGPDWIAPVGRALKGVQVWLNSLVNSEYVDVAQIYITEGYDNNFEYFDLDVNSFSTEVLNELKREYAMKSVCYVLH